MKAVVLIAALVLAASRPAGAQFFDPDACLTCYDSRMHAAYGAAAGLGARLVLPKARTWHRLAAVAAIGAAFELGQWDSHRDQAGQRGFGFGLKDLACDVAGAVATELVVSAVKQLLR